MPERSRGDATPLPNDDTDFLIQDVSGLEELCDTLYTRVGDFLKDDPSSQLLKDVQEQTKITLGVIEEALERYSLNQLCLSYNGGKDCLVLLVLYLATLHSHYYGAPSLSSRLTSPPARQPKPFPTRLSTVYIQHPHSFAEVDEFVKTSSEYYRLSLASSALPMKAAFAQYLELNPNVQAIFVGTRRTDPHGANLTHFDPTDSGWPPFMRIHPVIDWHYQEIWMFIKQLQVSYCSLYDSGYTSLGGTNDTYPNPKLKVVGGEDDLGKTQYRPAYELTEDDEERLGRDWHKK